MGKDDKKEAGAIPAVTKEKKEAAPKKVESGGVGKKKDIPSIEIIIKVLDHIKEITAALKVIKGVSATAKISELSAGEKEAFSTVYVFKDGTDVPESHTKKERADAHKLMGTPESKDLLEKIASL